MTPVSRETRKGATKRSAKRARARAKESRRRQMVGQRKLMGLTRSEVGMITSGAYRLVDPETYEPVMSKAFGVLIRSPEEEDAT